MEVQELLQEWMDTSYWLLDSLNGVEQEKVKSLRLATQEILTRLSEPDTEHVPLSSLKVHTDFWIMCDEIKEYTRNHGGKIYPADIPEKLMMGFIHENGTHWAIKIFDLRKSYPDSNKERFVGSLTNVADHNTTAKLKLCEVLSGTTDFTTEHQGDFTTEYEGKM